MTSRQFPVFHPAGNRVADAYECEAEGLPVSESAGAPLVFVRLGTTGLYMTAADAYAFADMILTEVAVADIAYILPEGRSIGEALKKLDARIRRHLEFPS